MKIAVKVDTSKVFLKQNLTQVPFATALALTRTAQDAQAEVRRELTTRFTIRNNWVSQGIRIIKATKQNLEAVVYSKDDFMVLQEKGGAKTPRGNSIAIPEGARTNKRGIVTAANRPGALRSRPGVFRARIGGLDGLWQRIRGHKSKRRKGERVLKLLFVFKPSVPVSARFGFVETVRKIARSRFARQFELALGQAIKTAR